ncbi:Outer membrane protein TolC [Saccharicrinis carchari]|uniref:Outer membrane protein TolC n=1 Tax=Saccharicrinis carchari TaxID=1168039 RepID=A0A521B2E3_SACCC|nr:TolC family protein [Saccharicrinis carchari]SMO41216.1 Outer membrane protein TolC [Saccharicrinis carchari]
MNVRVFYVCFILLLGSILNAQEKQISLNLKQAQEYALQHNKNLMNAKSDLLIAAEDVREARSAGLPQAEGTMDYMTNFNYSFNFGPGSEIVMEDQMNAKLQVSQLIFSGQYWVGLETAKIARRIAEKNIELSEMDVRENISNSYYLILVTKKLLQIVNENELNLQNMHEHTRNMFKMGLAERSDVDQISINLSEIVNTRKSMERNLQLNYNMLRLWLGVESEEEVVLTEKLDDIISQMEGRNLIDPNLDISDNPNYQIMLVQEDLGHKNIQMQRWAYAPTISGFYSYTEKIMKSDFDLSPKNVAGINLNIPLFSGLSRKAQLSKAKVEYDKIKRSTQLLEEQLTLQERQLIYEKNNAYENYITQKQNVEVSERVFQSMNNKYKQGQISSLELTQANSNYLQAENNYVSSVLQFLQSMLQLDKLYNNL